MTTEQELQAYAIRVKGQTKALEYLSHFGVKGQKWGVRRAERKAAAADHKEWLKSAKSVDTANAVFQKAAETFGPVAKKINNDPMFKGKDLTKDRGLARQYDAVMTTVFNQHLAQASVNMTMNNDQTRAVIYQFDRGSTLMRATEVMRVDHADGLDGFPDYRVELDENGFVVGVTLVEELQQSAAEILEYLEHFGVKGQKWGVRRKRTNQKPAPPDVKKMSNEELKAAVARLQLERQFKDLSKNQNRTFTGHGAKFASEILKDVGKQHAKKLVVEGVAVIATGAVVAAKMARA